MRIKQLHHVMGLTMSQHRGKQVKRQVARFEVSIKTAGKKIKHTFYQILISRQAEKKLPVHIQIKFIPKIFFQRYYFLPVNSAHIYSVL